MKTVAFHIEKGGSGKTTMCGNIGAELADRKKVLMIDGDPQGNLSSWYLIDSFAYDLADVLQGKATVDAATVQVRDNLWILPTAPIGGELKAWSETALFQKPFAFHDLLSKLHRFDIVLFDLGPGISNLEKSILAVVDEVVGVLAAEYFSADGLEIFEHEIEQLRRDRRASFVSDKLIINRVNRSYAIHKAYLEQYEKLRYKVFTIGQSTGVSDCVPVHQSLFEYAPRDRTIDEFKRLAGEVGKNGS